ncbi:MAG: rhodanese-like domain-containing protein [Panacagrimonas sp.]
MPLLHRGRQKITLAHRHVVDRRRFFRDQATGDVVIVEQVIGHHPQTVRSLDLVQRQLIERDIETRHPDKDQPLYLYCGGGFRSALAAQNLQHMGYTQIRRRPRPALQV